MKVFLSHSSSDKDRVALIALALLRTDPRIHIWLDKPDSPNTVIPKDLRDRLARYRRRVKKIEIGSTWSSDIHHGVADANVVLLFWSNDAIDKYNGKSAGTLQDEVSIAQQHFKLVQTLLEDSCKERIPPPLSRSQKFDLSPSTLAGLQTRPLTQDTIRSLEKSPEFRNDIKRLVDDLRAFAKSIRADETRPTFRSIQDNVEAARLVDRKKFHGRALKRLSDWKDGARNETQFFLVSARNSDMPDLLFNRIKDHIWPIMLKGNRDWQPTAVDWPSVAEDPDEFYEDLRLEWGSETRHSKLAMEDDDDHPIVLFCTVAAAQWTEVQNEVLKRLARDWMTSPSEAPVPGAALVVIVVQARSLLGSRTEEAGLDAFRRVCVELSSIYGKAISVLKLEKVTAEDARNLTTTLLNMRRDVRFTSYVAHVERRFKRPLSFKDAVKVIAETLPKRNSDGGGSK